MENKTALGRRPKAPGESIVCSLSLAASQRDLTIIRELAALMGARSASEAIRLAIHNEYGRRRAQ